MFYVANHVFINNLLDYLCLYAMYSKCINCINILKHLRSQDTIA